MEKEHSKTGNSGQLPANPEAVEVEELDIEEFSKLHGGKPPKAKPEIVTTGNRALRSTCRPTTIRSRSPFALAVRT